MYTYDDANRLLTVTTGAGTITYAYNGDGDRISQNVNGTLTTYILDTSLGLTQVLAETSDGGTTYIHYLHGLDLVAESDGTSTDYFAYDGLGSVRQLTDSSATVLLTQTFDPYGNLYASAGTAQSAYGYTGEYQDSNGLLFLRARYYNPTQGRFLNMDPSRQELNPYQYGGANPINFTDPSGQICIFGTYYRFISPEDKCPVDDLLASVASFSPSSSRSGSDFLEDTFGICLADHDDDGDNDGGLPNGAALLGRAVGQCVVFSSGPFKLLFPCGGDDDGGNDGDPPLPPDFGPPGNEADRFASEVEEFIRDNKGIPNQATIQELERGIREGGSDIPLTASDLSDRHMTALRQNAAVAIDKTLRSNIRNQRFESFARQLTLERFRFLGDSRMSDARQAVETALQHRSIPESTRQLLMDTLRNTISKLR